MTIRKRRRWRRTAALALAGLLLFAGGCAAPPAVQTGKQSVPADSFSIRTVLTNEKRDRILVETALPVFSGFSAADELNRKIQKLTDDGVSQLREETADIASGAGVALDRFYYGSFFDYSRNGDVLSVWISSENYSGGAHGMHWITSFTVDTKTGKFYSPLSSLFRDPKTGVQKITDGILKKIEAQPDGYLPNAAQASQTVKDKKGDYGFYLDGGNLVVYFDVYELLPYAAGIPTYAFPAGDLDPGPKLSPLPPLGNVRCNGAAVPYQGQAFSGDSGVFLPLEETSALLGHGMTKKNGEYDVEGRKAPTKTIQGKVYAPLTFFTDALHDFVVYDGAILRFYTAEPVGTQAQGMTVLLGQY